MAAEGDESLSRARLAAPIFGVAIAVAFAGLVTGLVLFAALQKVGVPGAIAPALAVGLLILVRYPALATALLLIGVVVFEPVDPGLLPTFNRFYTVLKASLTPVDIIFYVALVGFMMRYVTESRRPLLPEPLVGPLGLLGLATIFGVITGYTAHADVSNGDLYHRAINNVYLIFVPLLVVNTLRNTSALRMFLAILAALAAVKGLSGAFSALSGTGSQLTEETVSYLEPVPNLVMLMLVLGAAVALVRRQRMPVWIMAGAPLALLALLLSYRRSFWIAAAFALVLVVVIASRNRGKAVFALSAVALGLTFFTVASIGAEGPAASPILKRAQQLSPTGIEANRGDRYRQDERANVIANLEENPLTGIGLGVPWKVHSPLAESHDRRYVHFALLYFWLAFGPLGTIAYLVLMGAGLWTAVQVWRRHPDPIVQIGAIAGFGTIVAVVIVELTTTFTGIEPRFSIVLGGAFGWLAAAWRDLPRQERLAPPTL